MYLLCEVENQVNETKNDIRWVSCYTVLVFLFAGRIVSEFLASLSGLVSDIDNLLGKQYSRYLPRDMPKFELSLKWT